VRTPALLGAFLVFCLGEFTSGFAQTKPPSDQKAGDCSINVNGNGNTASLVCDGIDPTLAKQIREILHSTRQNTSAAKEMSEKLDRIIKHMDQEDAQPLVGLKILGPKGPGIACVNESDVIARDIVFEIVVWNRDTLDTQLLPIPSQSCGWLRPHDESPPYDTPSLS